MKKLEESEVIQMNDGLPVTNKSNLRWEAGIEPSYKILPIICFPYFPLSPGFSLQYQMILNNKGFRAFILVE